MYSENAIARIRADLRSAVNRALAERQADGNPSTLDVERAALAAVDRWPPGYTLAEVEIEVAP